MLTATPTASNVVTPARGERAAGTWLFHCPELDLHLAGTVDQTKGQAIPFRLMAQILRAW